MIRLSLVVVIKERAPLGTRQVKGQRSQTRDPARTASLVCYPFGVEPPQRLDRAGESVPVHQRRRGRAVIDDHEHVQVDTPLSPEGSQCAAEELRAVSGQHDGREIGTTHTSGLHGDRMAHSAHHAIMRSPRILRQTATMNQDIPAHHPALVFAHADDSVLSAFAVLHRARRHAVDIVACAGAPPDGALGSWDERCGFGSGVAAMTARRAEHRALFTLLGIPTVMLDLDDGQYGPASAKGFSQAVDRAIAVCAASSADALVTHRADAFHPDHRLAAAVAGQIAATLTLPMMQVCDRPYVECSRGRCDNGCGSIVRLSEDEWKAKRAAVGAYRSQLSALRSAFGDSWSSRSRLGWECYDMVAKSRRGADTCR